MTGMPHNKSLLLGLPDELWLHLLSHLSKVDKIVMGWTCRRARNIADPPWQVLLDLEEWRELKAVTRLSRFHRLELGLIRRPDPSVALCWDCRNAHPIDCFFPSQLRNPSASRSCKQIGIFPVPDHKPFTWLQVRALMGAPGMGSKVRSEFKEAYQFGYFAHPWSLPVYEWTLRRGTRPGVPGIVKPLRTWDCCFEIRFIYSALKGSRSISAETMGMHADQFICRHLRSNSDKILKLSRTLTPSLASKLSHLVKNAEGVASDPPVASKEGRCDECDTRFRLVRGTVKTAWSHPSDDEMHVQLVVQKNIGRIDVADPFENPQWMSLIVNPASALKTPTERRTTPRLKITN